LWPALQQDANGAILVIDAKNNKFENDIDDWVNNFTKPGNIDINNIICLSYSKNEDKVDKVKSCMYFNHKLIANQFPQLNIKEVSFDINSLIPFFNKYILGLFARKD